ncbi:unnamed protein product, partial [Symbiodinium sp. KB8]
MFTTYHTAEHLSRHARKWFFCRLVAAFPQAADMATSLAMYVPCPHALLTLEGKWPQCAFPRVLRGRHSAAWIHGRELLMANGIPEPDQQLVPAEVSRRTADWNLNPESLLSLGRNLQDLLSFTTPNAMAAATATANVHLLILHKMREQMLLQGALMSQTIYDLEQVVPICVDRCRAQSSDASSQRASTLFASVGPGYDFVLQGHSTMLVEELPEAWRHAQVLLCAQHEKEPDKEASSREFLQPRLQLLPGVPTAVGSGRASVPHKIRAVAHSQRLEVNSWGQVAVLMNSTFSLTGDLGTESRVCGWAGDLDMLMGKWISSEDGAEEEEPDVTPHYRLDFRKQIFVSGLLYNSHSMSRDLEAALQHWETYVTQLTHVCRLLQQPWSCQRLVRTCMQRAPRNAWIPEIEAFKGKVYSGRWGTTMDATRQLVPLLEVVRNLWDVNQFRSKAGGADADDGREGEAARQLSLEVVQQALSSDLFQAYSHAMLSIADAILHIQHWCEGCPCKHHSSTKMRNTCPMKTRRAPELAAGQLSTCLQSVFDVAHGGLLAHASLSKVRDEERQTVLVDFAAARQHIDLSLRVKLSHWQQLPYVLFGLGHASEAVQRSSAQRSLKLFDSACQTSQQDVSPSHHYLSVLLCSPGTASRRELETLAAGDATLEELPLLLPWASRFRFTPVAKGLRASAKRHVRAAPHAGPAHLAFESARPFLQEWLCKHADQNSLLTLGKACQQTKNLRYCLTCSGCWKHPFIQQLMQAQGSVRNLARKARHQCVEVLFHCDSHDHFRDIPEGLIVQQARMLTPAKWSLPEARNASSEDELWAKHAMHDLKDFVKQQMQTAATAESEGSAALSNLVIVSVNSTVVPVALQTFVNPTPAAALEHEDLFQFMSVEDNQQNTTPQAHSSKAEVPLQNISFFRVAQLNPGKAKTAPGVARVSGDDTLIVELLPAFRYDAESKEAIVGLEGSHSSHDRSGSLFVLDALHYPCSDLLGMQAWKYEQRLHFHLDVASVQEDPALAEAVRAVLQDVVSSRAFSGLQPTAELSVLQLMLHLKQQGWTCCEKRPNAGGRFLDLKKHRRSNPKRSARPGRGAAIPAITSDAADELDSDGRDVVSDEDADPEESSANAEPSASSSGSSSNSGSSGKSSSDSSSSSSGGSASAAEDEDSDAERRPGHGHATQLLATSFFWKGCRFTRSKADGEHIGWECTCRDPKHREGEGIAAACRRSLRFARHGGEEVVLRKLKWWLLQSYDYDTRREHVAECPWVPLLGVDYLPRFPPLLLHLRSDEVAAGGRGWVRDKARDIQSAAYRIMKQPLPAPALASITEEAEAQEPVVRSGDRGQSQDEQLEEVLDMLATDLSVSNGGRASSRTSSRSDVQSGPEELVPDDMMMDEFKKRTLEHAELESEESAAKKTREGESSEPVSPSKALYPPLFAVRVSQEDDVFRWDEHEDLTAVEGEDVEYK